MSRNESIQEGLVYRRTGAAILLSAAIFLFCLLTSNHSKPSVRPALALSAPLCNLDWSLGNSSCSGRGSFFASLLDHEPKLGPERCHCPGASRTLAGSWNNCISCLYVTFLSMHNGLAKGFEADPQAARSGAMVEDGLSFSTSSSPLEGYDNHARITPASGAICINLHQSRGEDSSERVKAILHLDSKNCPDSGTRGAHALAMKLDFGYSDTRVRTAEFFHTGEYESNGFDVSSNDNDDIFYLKIKHQLDSQRTTAWAYRISRKRAWKFFMDGIDDKELYVASQFDSDPASNEVGLTGMSAQCVDDANDKPLDFEACKKKGFGFQRFPLPLSAVTEGLYPSWTSQSLQVEGSKTVGDYFK